MPRNVLLLQGPVGPFFKKLATDLERHGHNVVKVNLNGGDWFFYRTGDVLNFREDTSVWPFWIESVMVGRQIDRIYLFGDCRAYHRQAISIARRLNIEVYVFEEGYVRPNYITLERDGVNGFSSACDPATIADQLEAPSGGATQSAVESKPVDSVFFRATCLAMQYYMASSALRWRFPNYVHHRPLKTLSEGSIWIRSGFRKWIYKFTQYQTSKRLLQGTNKFFLVPLQVHNDMQVIQHSDFGSVEEFIDRVMISFTSADENTDIVFKHHPYDRGYKNYKKLIAQLAVKYGLSGRVHYIHDTDLPNLLQRAEGAVLINSTVGISSMYHQTPVKAMGKAIYDLPGLTHQGSLESFWQNPEPVDAQKYAAYRDYLISTTQLNGSIYTGIADAKGAMGVNWCDDKFKAHLQPTFDNVVDISERRNARKLSVVQEVKDAVAKEATVQEIEDVGRHGNLAV
jgi:capsule polysaccharide modification protein KpsS